MVEPYKLTIAEASSQIAAGELTRLSLMESFIERIDRLDPELKAWVTVDREGALEQAARLDREAGSKAPTGPLHGVPIGVKDIYYTAGMKTTACSKIHADFTPDYDAAAVERLKAAGAIVLGKTVTTEFASGDPPPTLNPWNPAHTPGGSSSGSAVAVAARQCPGAMGSQTGGSILRPSSFNGIVGLKPTFGRISCYGVMPLAWSLDTLGPMVNCVEDAAIMLQALAGYDARDPGSADEPAPDYRRAFIEGTGARPRIGLISDFFLEQCDAESRQGVLAVAETLAEAGAMVEDAPLPPSFSTAHHVQWVVSNVETAAYHEENFRARAGDYSSKLRKGIEIGILTPAVRYVQAQRLRRRYRREMAALAARWDVLLTPTTPTAAPRDLSTTGNPVFQSPWTSCGLPTITLPCGLSPSTGLPLGVQLAASPFNEAGLLAAAGWCEGVLNARVAPPQVS